MQPICVPFPLFLHHVCLDLTTPSKEKVLKKENEISDNGQPWHVSFLSVKLSLNRQFTLIREVGCTYKDAV